MASFLAGGGRESGSASRPLLLHDTSGRTLELRKDDDGAVRATVRFSPLISWSVRMPPEQVAELKEWLG